MYGQFLSTLYIFAGVSNTPAKMYNVDKNITQLMFFNYFINN